MNIKLILVVLIFSLTGGCKKTNDEIAQEAIKSYLNENLDDMSSYEPVLFDNIDTLLVFKGYIVNYQNHKNPFQVVYNKKGNLGFYNSKEKTVLVFNENDLDIFLINRSIGIFDHKRYQFYLVENKTNKNIPKPISLFNLKQNNKPIKYSKLDSIELQVFHSFRIKDSNSQKRIYKYYFRLNNKFKVLEKSDTPYTQIDYSHIYYDKLISDTLSLGK